MKKGAENTFEGLKGRELGDAIEVNSTFRLLKATKLDKVTIPAGALGRVAKMHSSIHQPLPSAQVVFDPELNPDIPSDLLKEREYSTKEFWVQGETLIDRKRIEWLERFPSPKSQLRVTFTQDTADAKALMKLVEVYDLAMKFQAKAGRKTVDELVSEIKAVEGMGAYAHRHTGWSGGRETHDWVIILSVMHRSITVKLGEKRTDNFVHGLSLVIRNLNGTVQASEVKDRAAHWRDGERMAEMAWERPDWAKPGMPFDILNSLLRLDHEGDATLAPYQLLELNPALVTAQVPGVREVLKNSRALLEKWHQVTLARLSEAEGLLDELAARAESAQS